MWPLGRKMYNMVIPSGTKAKDPKAEPSASLYLRAVETVTDRQITACLSSRSPQSIPTPPASVNTTAYRRMKSHRTKSYCANSHSFFLRWNDEDEVHIIEQLDNVPAIVFVLFPELPSELRCKIWYWAGHVPRFIEIRRRVGRVPEWLTDHSVNQKSRLVPAVLQVNREARYEAGKVYDKYPKISFDSVEGRPIHFNPRADIVYFGESVCFPRMIRVFQRATREGLSIPRVAIVLEKRCNLRGNGFVCGYDDLRDPYGGGISEMRVLHGFESSDLKHPTSLHNQWNGCPGLQEVLFVVKLDTEAVDPSSGFRPATTNGVTEGQVSKKEAIELQIGFSRFNSTHLSSKESSIFLFKWSKELPDFRFVSAAPAPSPEDQTLEEIDRSYHRYSHGERNWSENSSRGRSRSGSK